MSYTNSETIPYLKGNKRDKQSKLFVWLSETPGHGNMGVE